MTPAEAPQPASTTGAAPTSPAPTVDTLCSDADLTAGDDPRGSAAEFTTFVLIEHLSGFGREAADDALRAVYGDDTAAVTAVPGLRPFAIRPVGRAGSAGSRVRWTGRTGGNPLLNQESARPTPADLRRLDTAPGTAAEPLFAVCTNGSRDRCCALKGRDLAATLHSRLDDPDDEPAVVEISHLGGHRFAPTMLVLPWGYAYSWLDTGTALDVAYAAQDGLVHPTGLRGRADLSPAAQVAEAIWRTELGVAPVTAVRIGSVVTETQIHHVAGTVDGRDEILRLRRRPGPTIGATACGGKPIGTGRWERL